MASENCYSKQPLYQSELSYEFHFTIQLQTVECKDLSMLKKTKHLSGYYQDKELEIF